MTTGPDLDRTRFRASVAEKEGEGVRNAIYSLLDFAERNASKVRGGAKMRSFHYAVAVGNEIVNLFTCDGSGYVSVSFANFRDRLPLGARENLADRLAAIPGLENVRRYSDRPGFFIAETVVDPNIMSRFQCAILAFQDDVKAL